MEAINCVFDNIFLEDIKLWKPQIESMNFHLGLILTVDNHWNTSYRRRLAKELGMLWDRMVAQSHLVVFLSFLAPVSWDPPWKWAGQPRSVTSPKWSQK